jgi:ribosomal protein S18 acetylase RimI-like enzyme
MRPLRIEDYPQIYRLWKSCEGVDINDIDESREGIEKYLQRNPSTCFVEERDGKIVGVIMAGHDGRRGTLHHHAVDRQYRRRGIGTALCEKAMGALKEEGIGKAGLFVYRNNEIGLSFWKKEGFSDHDDYDYYDIVI